MDGDISSILFNPLCVPTIQHHGCGMDPARVARIQIRNISSVLFAALETTEV